MTIWEGEVWWPDTLSLVKKNRNRLELNERGGRQAGAIRHFYWCHLATTDLKSLLDVRVERDDMATFAF